MMGYICDREGCGATLPLEYGHVGQEPNGWPQAWYVGGGPGSWVSPTTLLGFCSPACLLVWVQAEAKKEAPE